MYCVIKPEWLRAEYPRTLDLISRKDSGCICVLPRASEPTLKSTKPAAIPWCQSG